MLKESRDQLTPILLALSTLVSGLAASETATESRSGPTEPAMKEIGKTTELTDLASSLTLMEMSMKGTG